MNPKIALIGCVLFVAWLLRIERKQAPDVSRALWIPTIWMLIIASKPLAIWFGVYGNTSEGSPLDRLFLSVLLCLGLCILVSKKFAWSRAIGENSWLILLIGYMFISIFWSDTLFTSFKRWIRELVALVMAFIVLTERDPRQAALSIFRRSIYILIPFSLLLINYFPEYGRQYGRWSGNLMWVGVTTQKNGLGGLCFFSAFFLIWSIVRKWQGRDNFVIRYQMHADVVVLIITFWLLKGPQGAYSATSIVVLVVGLVFYIYLLCMKKRRKYLGSNTLTMMIAILIGFGIVTVMTSGIFLDIVSSGLGRDNTFTGRTLVWEDLLLVGLQRPITGVGFGGFWTSTTRETYNISGAHSGYVDIFLELGFIGLLLFLIFLLSSCRKAQRELKHDFEWASLVICFIIMAVLHNITESSFNSLTTHLTAVLLFFAVSSNKATSYVVDLQER